MTKRDPEDVQREWYEWQHKRDADRQRARIVGCVFLVAIAAAVIMLAVVIAKVGMGL